MADYFKSPMPVSPSTRMPRGPQWRLLLTTLTVVMAWIGQVGHFAFVSHRLCVEHGQLVHGDAHDHAADDKALGADTADGAATGQHAEHRAPVASSDENEQHEHDHCAVVSEHGDCALDLAPVTLQQLDGFSNLTLRATAWLRSDSQRFHFAPKTSPPARS